MGLIVAEFIGHLLSLDVLWLAWFIYSNLFFVFAFFAFSHFLTEGKKFTTHLFWLATTILVVWTTNDMQIITGWLFYASAAFMALHFISRLTVVFFTESIPQLKRWFSGALVLQAVVVWTLFNLYRLNFG